MKWFRHDATANQDAKLKRVRMKYGMEGYGLYWYCIEMIAVNVDQKRLTFDLEHDAEIIAFDTGIHYERVNEMMAFMVNLGLFEDSGGVITCLKLAKRADEYTAKYLKVKLDEINSGHTPDTIGTKSSPKEIKGKEITLNNNYPSIPDKPEKDSVKAVDQIFIDSGISKDQVSEIRSIRKNNKGGKITERVAKTLINEFFEAGKTGMTLDDILDEWASRSWKSFKAEWVKPKPLNGYQTAQDQRAAAARRTFDPEVNRQQLEGV